MAMEDKGRYSLVTARTSSTKRCILNRWFEIENLRIMAMQRSKKKEKAKAKQRERENRFHSFLGLRCEGNFGGV